MMISVQGITALQEVSRVAEIASKIRKEEFSAEKRRHAATIEDIAKKEVARDFPTLHSQAVLALWHGLDNNIRQLVATWLLEHPSTLEIDAIQKLKVRLGEFL